MSPSRNHAYEALAALATSAGRPGAAGSPYVRARRSCLTHLRTRFGEQLTDKELLAIVERRLVSYLSPLMVLHLPKTRPSPDEVLSQLDNAALDKITGVKTDATANSPGLADDSMVLAKAFGEGIDASGFQFALRMARRLREKTEYLVAIQYVDLLHTTGHADVAEVAKKLQLDESTVRKLLSNFQRRLPRRTS